MLTYAHVRRCKAMPSWACATSRVSTCCPQLISRTSWRTPTPPPLQRDQPPLRLAQLARQTKTAGRGGGRGHHLVMLVFFPFRSRMWGGYFLSIVGFDCWLWFSVLFVGFVCFLKRVEDRGLHRMPDSASTLTAALLLLYCCFTAALLLLY